MLKSRWNVCIHAASSRVWLCLAASCSQDAFDFLFFTIDLAKTSGHWHECSSDRFCENPTCNMKYLNVDVQLNWRDGVAKLCASYVYSCYAPLNLKNPSYRGGSS